MTYRPEPIDTAAVNLPGELVPLRELLARNTHENWSAQRIGDGWECHRFPSSIPAVCSREEWLRSHTGGTWPRVLGAKASSAT